MKTTPKRYTGEFEAEVALEAIRGDLTLAEPASRHGIRPTMIATWKRQAIEGMAATFVGASQASKAAGDTEIEKLHAKIGQLVVERDFCRRGSRDKRRTTAGNDRAETHEPDDRGAVSAGIDQPILLLLRAGAGNGGSADGSAIIMDSGPTLVLAAERRTRSMGRQVQRHIRAPNMALTRMAA